MLILAELDTLIEGVTDEVIELVVLKVGEVEIEEPCEGVTVGVLVKDKELVVLGLALELRVGDKDVE
jgi:hypothetical protein